MLYYVLVYECVLVQILSARSGVLFFNRLSNQSVVVLLVSCHLCQFQLRLNHFAFVNIYSASMKSYQFQNFNILENI